MTNTHSGGSLELGTSLVEEQVHGYFRSRPVMIINPLFVYTQMDWMSAKLRDLISEGQKALGRQVVLAEHEDSTTGILDDGDPGWVDDEGEAEAGRRRIGKRKRAYSPLKQGSYGWEFDAGPSPLSRSVGANSAGVGFLEPPEMAARSTRGDWRTKSGRAGDDEGSEALREQMEQVRKAYRERIRAVGTG